MLPAGSLRKAGNGAAKGRMMREEKGAITSLEAAGLLGWAADEGLPAWRAKQLYGWLHAKGAASFDEMTDLPLALREKLAQNWRIETAAPVQVQTSGDGTQKMLFRLHDGAEVEAVLMHYNHGDSVCISSQAGCRMGCAFCASAPLGLGRSLTAGEMLAQVYAAGRISGTKPNHVVLMGIGEPLDNYEQVLKFVRMVNDEAGYGLSARNISLSTCGVVPGIRRLADEGLGITLSVSLHAPNDALRDALMPVNRRWPLAELMAACADYQKATGRRISFEYAMMQGVNDGEREALALARLMAGMGRSPRPHVNLIGINAVAGTPYAPSSRAQIEAFAAVLEKQGVNVTVRRRLGTDIDAACGQLRAGRIQEQAKHEKWQK